MPVTRGSQSRRGHKSCGAYSQMIGLWAHVKCHFGNHWKRKTLMTLTRGDKCHANMHLEAIGPRELELYQSHRSVTYMKKQDRCHSVQ